jgi:putative nucleotidyltransferase with HDIG domain
LFGLSGAFLDTCSGFEPAPFGIAFLKPRIRNVDLRLVMSVQALDDSERLRLSFEREAAGLARAELRAELVAGGGFVLAAAALLVAFSGPMDTSVGVLAIYVLALAAAGRARFDFGSGFTVPTQIVFVPMLFAAPSQYVPVMVALGMAIGSVPDVIRGTIRPARLLLCLGNSWFAVGPAAVLAAGHVTSPGASPALLVAALASQFATDCFGNVLRESLRGGTSLRELIAELMPVYAIDAALAPVGLAVAFATDERPWAVLLVLPLLALLSVFARERRARLEQLVELNDAYRGTALVLGDVVESDDAYTGEHCKDVVELALGVAQEMGLSAHARRCVEFGALLHDVGKLAVPKEIINKPDVLDEREWQIIKMHTIEGQKLLERVGGIMREVGEIVRSSHERWDGGGYPDGLAGEDIPLEARIVSACDAYNAMTTTRSYRAAMPYEEALAELERNSGSQFDPVVIAALIRVVERNERAAA